MPSVQPKIIITGTGRTGTTLLVQLLTELGLDTGYTVQNWSRDYSADCAAGLEYPLTNAVTPRIIKNPALCATLPGLLRRGEIAVEHAIIPVRSLEDAAHSRVRIGGRGMVPGGLTGTKDPASQKGVLAENFHQLVHTLTAHDIPHTFLDFPRFAQDPLYTWEKLRWLLAGVERDTFVAAFERVARPELIHDFARGVPGTAGESGRLYERRREKKRWRRRLERAVVWSAMIAAGWWLCVWSRS